MDLNKVTNEELIREIKGDKSGVGKTYMGLSEFLDTVAELLLSSLGDGFKVSTRNITKNNGVVYHAILISKEGRCIAPTIYIDGFYKGYRDGMPLKKVVMEILAIYRNSMPKTDLDMDFFFDFAKVADKLFFKVVNYEKNKKKLENVPYRKLMDMAMVPLCRMKSRVLGEGVITIERDHLKSWEITEDELWENIGEHAASVAPPKITGLVDFLENATGLSLDMDPLCGIRVVTNTSGTLGASAAFYPGILEEIAKDMECDLYIIPSSIHETLVVPDPQLDTDAGFIRSMIHEVNTTTVAEEEVLSDNLYRYDRLSGRLYVVKAG